ncbi:hypothetical protein [Tateyamaria omphalii]|uniref:D-galactarate dehydratase n=1 Tax=Tateyamaria omphalii TaxID=299262 RepID=A0A1P8MUQ2_9RHOB|nr:hypothetical protein [Tateyamaria omphalii]APX11785.1 hypothetical protein BWR18_08885 [Tateyamaria omphalii]
MRWMMFGVCGLALSACDVVPQWAGGTRPAAVVAEGDEPVAPDVAAKPEDETVIGADDVLGPEGEVSIGTLGRTVASLGNAAEPGLWLKTPLVSVEQPGRVYYDATNTTVDVTLIPIDGPATAGSRLSLAAMQALGAPLTGLPEVDVFGG